MEDYLVLLARFHPAFVRQELIPEIERNCEQFGIYDQTAYEIFQKNKFAVNSLYFHHSYAMADIPAGREYDAIAYRRNWKIQSDSIQECTSKILCFFTAFKTQPSIQAMRGHHELSLIQFENGLPSMLNELFEVTERKPIDISGCKEIYLGSEMVLKRLVRKEAAISATAVLLKACGITNEKDYRLLDGKKAAKLLERIKQETIERHQLEDSDLESVIYGGLNALRWTNSKNLKRK